jgi:ferredoxin
VEECATCHEGVASVEDLRAIRMAGSAVDYDGDGDVEEGISTELTGLQEALYANIQAYAAEVAGSPIVYSPSAYPYFFIDTNADGELAEDEAAFPNAFKSWTPRLLKAAYNYQTSVKDPGAYAHGGKYIVQLLYDSIASLNEQIATPADMAAMTRNDAGHFDGSAEAFRHWDEDGAVPGSCARCHSADGLPTFLAEGVNVSTSPANGFQCATCHNDLQEFTLYEVAEVKFPSGATLSLEDPKNNLCLACHQGRQSSVSVDRAIGDAEADAVTESLSFLNPHYFAAGATLFGSDAMGAYQYADKEYAGYNKHSDVNQCTDCHNAHSLEVDWETCVECHEEVTSAEDLKNIRYDFVDIDGDGDEEEGLYFEEETMLENLLVAIQAYAAETAGTPIAYDAHSHPYWFIDTNANGVADPDEVNGDNRFNAWTPRLLRAAYNYQWASKDPGSFAHNGQYILQVLYDSLEDVGGDVAAMSRP